MILRLYRKITRSDRRKEQLSSTICERLPANPIITPDMLPADEGRNINGPSLIRAPEWLPGRLGRYYLYFAHHSGTTIRLAYADQLDGPWRIHAGGTLRLADAPACHGHIASPDVHVDEKERRIRMYFHGPSAGGGQKSYVALSDDGLRFRARSEALGTYYFRVVRWRGGWIAMAKGGVMSRSRDGLADFVANPRPAFPMRHPDANAPGDVRHVALHRSGDRLNVYFSRIGDAPERILRARIDLAKDPGEWIAGEADEILRPEMDWEGAHLRLGESRSGPAKSRENALRDPAIFEEDGRLYLLYSVAGESGIGIAEMRNR
jgi:hypothetical protein